MARRLAWSLTALLAVGCGGGTGEDAGTGADAGRIDAGADAGGVADAGGADGGMDMDGGSPIDGGADGGATTDAGSDAGTTADAGSDAGPAIDASGVSITLSGVAVYANCMPIVAPDPIIAFWETTVSGAPAGVSSATLTDAVLTITPSSGSPVVQSLTVDHPTIALTGGTGMEDQRKTGADTTPSGACGSLCDGASYQLVLTFDVGGATVAVTDSGSFGCVY